MSEEDKKASAETPIQSFDPTAKKKRKAKPAAKTEKKAEPAAESTAAGTPAPTPEAKKAGPTGEEAKDYEYKYLLERITSLLINKSKDPSVRKKVLIKPPDVQKLTGKRSVWINFDDTCKALDRRTEHLLQFVSTELNTDSSLNNEQQLIMKGKVTGKQIESVLKKYINDYVTCANCKHVNTTLYKNPRTRTYEMRCLVCHSIRSVAGIKAGFHAYARGERRREQAANQ